MKSHLWLKNTGLFKNTECLSSNKISSNSVTAGVVKNCWESGIAQLRMSPTSYHPTTLPVYFLENVAGLSQCIDMVNQRRRTSENWFVIFLPKYVFKTLHLILTNTLELFISIWSSERMSYSNMGIWDLEGLGFKLTLVWFHVVQSFHRYWNN